MSAASSSDPQPLELEIFSLPFRLRAPLDEHERLQRAAKHVDTTMRGLVAAQPSADTTRLAIQAAFLIATDYFRNADESFAGSGSATEVDRRFNDILRGLDIALNDMKKAMAILREEEAKAPGNLPAGNGKQEPPAEDVLQVETAVDNSSSAVPES